MRVRTSDRARRARYPCKADVQRYLRTRSTVLVPPLKTWVSAHSATFCMSSLHVVDPVSLSCSPSFQRGLQPCIACSLLLMKHMFQHHGSPMLLNRQAVYSKCVMHASQNRTYHVGNDLCPSNDDTGFARHLAVVVNTGPSPTKLTP